MKKRISVLMLVFAVKMLSAQDGTLDNSFGQNGMTGMKNVGDRGDLAAAMFITSDGKNVQAASSSTDSNTHYLLVRRTKDGILDKTFGNNGIALSDIGGRDGMAYSAIELPNGKYLLAGNCISRTLKYNMVLLLFKNNGTLDSSFGINGHVEYSIGESNDYPTGLLLQPDHKVVATGYTYMKGEPVFFAARFLPNGAKDTSFGKKGKTFISFGTQSVFANNAALQPNGKIIIVGSVQDREYYYDYAMVRLNSNGTPDNTFGKSGKVLTAVGSYNNFAYGIALQNKKIILAGYFSTTTKANTGIVRYNANGSVDVTFGNNGKTVAQLADANVDCFSVAVQPDAKIVAGATAYYTNRNKADYAVFRFNANGVPDASFGNNGVVTTSVTPGYDGLNTIKIDKQGKILAAGSSQSQTGISRLTETRYLSGLQTIATNKLNTNETNIEAYKKAEIGINVYPNPAKDYVHLKAAWSANEKVEVHIYNEEGKLVFSNSYIVQNANDVLTIAIGSKWKAGNYYITVMGDKIIKGTFTVIQ